MVVIGSVARPDRNGLLPLEQIGSNAGMKVAVYCVGGFQFSRCLFVQKWYGVIGDLGWLPSSYVLGEEEESFVETAETLEAFVDVPGGSQVSLHPGGGATESQKSNPGVNLGSVRLVKCEQICT